MFDELFFILMDIAMVVPGVYSYFLFRRVLKGLHLWKDTKWMKVLQVVFAILVTISCYSITNVSFVIWCWILIHDLFMFLADLLIKLFTRNKEPQKWQLVWKKVLLTGFVPIFATAISFIYGYFVMFNVTETHYDVVTEKKIDGGSFRICYISDYHCGVSLDPEQLQAVCDEIGTKNVDAVIIGGDVVDDATPEDWALEMFKSLGSIKTKEGVYFTFGNHDRTRPHYESDYTEADIKEFLNEFGITLVKDEVLDFGNGVQLIGREDLKSPYGDNRLSISELVDKADAQKFLVVSDHQPVEFKEVAANGADLHLSGHLHAGQLFPANIVVKIIDSEHVVWGRYLITQNGNKKRRNDGPAKEGEGTATAIVSAGLAGWSYPIKTAAPAEYCIIDIVNK